MVNNKTPSTKGLVLERLRSLAGEPISGETLAASLGVSRVAVWKAAASLREAGYAVESSEAGYRLDPASGEDFLYPWEFGEREPRFRHYGETSSTMDRARELTERGAPPFTVVVAERQSAGRGRAGRLWESEDGGLFFTLTLAGGTPLLRYARVSAAAQLAVAAAVHRTTGISAQPRWPNDIYAGDRKLAGALVELEAEGDRTRRMAVGVGINANNRPRGDGKTALAVLTGSPVSRRKILEAFLEAFEPVDPFAAEVTDRWNACAFGVGARAAMIDAGHGAEDGQVVGTGFFRGMDELGRAVLETDRGLLHLEAGSASLRF
jgi:BirA family biotin operon repressor/biotin-[acetyl-CoA-carboxylase] ligase